MVSDTQQLRDLLARNAAEREELERRAAIDAALARAEPVMQWPQQQQQQYTQDTAVVQAQPNYADLQRQIEELRKQLSGPQAPVRTEKPVVNAKRLKQIAEHLRTYGANNADKQRAVSGWIHEALGGDWSYTKEHPLWEHHANLQSVTADPYEVADALEEFAEHEGDNWTVNRGS